MLKIKNNMVLLKNNIKTNNKEYTENIPFEGRNRGTD